MRALWMSSALVKRFTIPIISGATLLIGCEHDAAPAPRTSPRGPTSTISADGLSPAVPLNPLTTCVFLPGPNPTTMVLQGNCTTDMTIPIPDGFTLDGDGHTITANDPPLDHFRGAVVKNGGTTANVVNLTVTASGLADVCDDGNDRLRGILFDGASGSITNSHAIEINQGASGCQEGNGIEVRNCDGGVTQTVVIENNSAVHYQKAGIVANCDVVVTITGNVVDGVGPVPYIAQNGIQLGFMATGEVSGNSISDNFYTGCSHKAAAKTDCIPFVAAGLLLYDVDASMIRRSNNMFSNNQFNVLLVTYQSLGS
jgi:hypothetical protein